MPTTNQSTEKIIPPHGGYRKLISYQKAEIIYDGTVHFTKRAFSPRDRTIDQMVQAARSGKQNIAEGSMASGTSKEMELKLMSVARASLEELKLDYEDFLRTHGLPLWDKQHHYYQQFDKINRIKPTQYDNYKPWIEHKDLAISANALRSLTNLCGYFLNKLILSLEQSFIQHGGFRESMYRCRKLKMNQQ